jgi:hypothetical protein
MQLSEQAMGAIMMALQKCLLEQTDIVPMLKEMDFHPNTADNTLTVLNPPVVNLGSTELGEEIQALMTEEE